MRFIKTTYQKAFVIGPYLQEKIGFEIEFDGSVESEQDALDVAKAAAEKWHIVNNPQVHGTDMANISPAPSTILPVIDKAEERRIGIMSDDIMSCQDLTTLDTYRLLVKGKLELETAYNLRREQIIAIETKDILARTNALTIK